MTGQQPDHHLTTGQEPIDLDIRRKRIRIRAWRRGMREMDILMGGFVDARLDSLDAAELAEFETLLDLPDDELFRWLCGAAPAPPERDTPLLRQIAAFHAHAGPIH
jgi:antitoxin CptB